MTEHLSTGPIRFLGRTARESLTRQRGTVFWFYGLSGAGKSTLASAVEKALHEKGHLTTLLDGDLLRTGLNRGLGFSDDDRRENLRRAAEVARLFCHTGVITLCSFITPTKAFRSLARQIVGEDDFHEIFVKADFDTCRARDVKGLYAKAARGEIAHFTGKDGTFEPPSNPDLTLDTESTTIEDATFELLEAIRHRIELR